MIPSNTLDNVMKPADLSQGGELVSLQWKAQRSPKTLYYVSKSIIVLFSQTANYQGKIQKETMCAVSQATTR
jgi:hypothetical protein